jgi:hypothetical protein
VINFLAEGTNLLSQFFDVYKNKQYAKGKQKDYNNMKTTQQIQSDVNKVWLYTSSYNQTQIKD